MAEENLLYLVRDIRDCERQAIHELELCEDELMARAGMAAFAELKKGFPTVRRIAVFCGGGNNAGDGYVLARLAKTHGFSVVVYQYKNADELPNAARTAARSAIDEGVLCQCLDDAIDIDAELIVDALLGIGLQGEVHGPIAHAINLINDSDLPVLSLDVPSGLDADTGKVLGVCVAATITLSFIGLKVGLFTLDGTDYCGQIINHNLQLGACLDKIPPAAILLQSSVLDVVSPRRKNSHKSLYGHVLVIGGGLGMPGAQYLAALAAMRVGAGLVTIATRPEYSNQSILNLPEAMIYGVNNATDLNPLLARASVCVIGPGLGEDLWAKDLFSAAIAAQLPLVVDASALRLLANNPQHNDNWILTPHPGEAAILLNCTIDEVQSDRLKATCALQQKFGGSIVLKGAGSIINTGERHAYLCKAGNPGMATAGMGDVLSGVIGGLLAQKIPLGKAAVLGVWLHANAADNATALYGERGLLAHELMPYLRALMNDGKMCVSEESSPLTGT